jgi:hypothetical protein
MFWEAGSGGSGKSGEEGFSGDPSKFQIRCRAEELMVVRGDVSELWSSIALLAPSSVKSGNGVMGGGNHTGIIDFQWGGKRFFGGELIAVVICRHCAK